MNFLGLPYTNIMTRFCSITQPGLAWTRLVRVLASQRVGDNVSSVCLLSWRMSLCGGAPGHLLGSVWRHGRGQDRAMAPRLCRLTITSHLHTCQGVTRGSPGGHHQCRGQADTRLRRRTSAQERYLTPAPAECGGGRAGPGGPRTPHS